MELHYFLVARHFTKFLFFSFRIFRVSCARWAALTGPSPGIWQLMGIGATGGGALVSIQCPWRALKGQNPSNRKTADRSFSNGSQEISKTVKIAFCPCQGSDEGSIPFARWVLGKIPTEPRRGSAASKSVGKRPFARWALGSLNLDSKFAVFFMDVKGQGPATDLAIFVEDLPRIIGRDLNLKIFVAIGAFD